MSNYTPEQIERAAKRALAAFYATPRRWPRNPRAIPRTGEQQIEFEAQLSAQRRAENTPAARAEAEAEIEQNFADNKKRI